MDRRVFEMLEMSTVALISEMSILFKTLLLPERTTSTVTLSLERI
jgi:hypothetical protein